MPLRPPAIRLPSPSLYVPESFKMPLSSVGYHQDDVCYESDFKNTAACVTNNKQGEHTGALFRNFIWRKFWKWGVRLYGLQATFTRMLVEDIRQACQGSERWP